MTDSNETEPNEKEMLDWLKEAKDALFEELGTFDSEVYDALRRIIKERGKLEKIIKLKDKLLAAYRLGDGKMADRVLNELEDIRDTKEGK